MARKRPTSDQRSTRSCVFCEQIEPEAKTQLCQRCYELVGEKKSRFPLTDQAAALVHLARECWDIDVEAVLADAIRKRRSERRGALSALESAVAGINVAPDVQWRVAHTAYRRMGAATYLALRGEGVSSKIAARHVMTLSEEHLASPEDVRTEAKREKRRAPRAPRLDNGDERDKWLLTKLQDAGRKRIR